MSTTVESDSGIGVQDIPCVSGGLRPERSPLFELQLISPIVCLWMAGYVIFTIVVNTWRGRPLEVLLPLLITHCGVGIFMTVVWVSFYGSMTWRRIAAGIGVVAANGALGTCLAMLFGRHWGPEILPFSLIAIFITLASLVLTGAVRRFWGWRIFHVLEIVAVADQKRFTIRDALRWTTVIAMVLAFSRVVLASFQDNFADSSWRIALLCIVGVGIPSIATVVFLGLAARLTIFSLMLAVPVQATCVAVLISALVLSGTRDIDTVMRYTFWPTLIWFCVAGLVMSATLWFLRRRGLVFAFGAGGDPASVALAKSRYQAYLRGKIARLRRRSTSLQYELDALGG